MRQSVRCFALVLASLLASSALCAQITLEAFTPDESSVGTALAIDVQGALGNAKPKLWLTRSDDRAAKPKQTKLKVQSVAELGKGVSRLTANFKKTKTGAGLYDLHLKAKGVPECVFAGAFSMRDPEPMSVSPDETFSKAQVTVTGEFFGEVGKPIVRLTASLGGKPKKAKVLSGSSGDTLLVKLPKLADGAYAMSVKTKIGEGVLENALVIGAGGGSGSPNLNGPMTASFAAADDELVLEEFSTALGNPLVAVSLANFFADSSLKGLNMFAQVQVDGGTVNIALNTTGFIPGVSSTPATISSTSIPTNFLVMGVTQVVGLGQTSSWTSAFGGPASVTITAATADHVEGTFEGLLGPVLTGLATGDLVVTKGSFNLAVNTITDEG